MPTITCDKADLYRRLGKELVDRTLGIAKTITNRSIRYTTEEFDQLCFDFGIELDEDVRARNVFCSNLVANDFVDH